MIHQPYIIGISGKIGSGKNYLANALSIELTRRGYVCAENSFARPLKDELTNIIHDRRNKLSILKISKKYDISFIQTWKLVRFFQKEINENATIDGYTKTNGIRRSLQYLGTDIRRRKDPMYWVNLLHATLPECDILFIPDTRFPSEADSVRSSDGFNMRLEVNREVILARASERDKIRYSAVSENHVSETALDDYMHFDVIVGESFDPEELADLIEEQVEEFKKH